MAPLSKQHDFQGKPQKVTIRTFESSDKNPQPRLKSIKYSDYDKEGNALRIETFDSGNRKTDSEVYGYDAEGTWNSLVEQSKESPQKTSRIFIDSQTKRIAQTDQKTKNIEFTTYTEHGFELSSVTQTATGKMLEKVTFVRNGQDKEESVIFEEPPGKRTTEISVVWTAQGFESSSTMILHDSDGDRIAISYEYPEIDSSGNWLTQIKKSVLHRSSGAIVTLPTETTKRTIAYHP